jgi:hypothetical protein
VNQNALTQVHITINEKGKKKSTDKAQQIRITNKNQEGANDIQMGAHN